jgi:RimJ/RimL family protein N-acetyltransferase
MIQISPAHTSDLPAIENLATIIWNEHYSPIIGKEQVSYMLDKFQSRETMLNQINEGYFYFKIEQANKLIGYCAIQFRDVDKTKECFISKIYLSKETRGQGIGTDIFQFITDLAIKNNATLLKLTVNKYNSDSIKVYHKIGFKTSREVVFDIGGGYIMDDFELIKEI